ncbi:MAG: response regulator [Planctomycetaceae bacterium]|nr:response regulator [Planctomycetales bacterium]MCB9926664.1 response regulator [Planctomycetaceae bacterium]
MTSTASEPGSASVLIVDRSEETRDVLRTILETRGLSILEAKRGATGLELLREQHPRVVILDLEVDEGDTTGLQGAYEAESRRDGTCLVMLGKVKGSNRSDDNTSSETRHIIEKPYHYGPLIRTIEQLLEQQDTAA